MYEGFDAKERTVARKLVKALLAQGYELTVYDGGDDAAIRGSTSFKDVWEALGNTGMDAINVRSECVSAGSGQVVWGNSPEELISDYGWSPTDVGRVFKGFMEGFTGH